MPYFDNSDQEFLQQKSDPIPGWLLHYAARTTIALMNYQDEIGVSGSFMEIGVFAGRYLSLLYRAAKRSGVEIVGLDPFIHYTPEQVASYVGAADTEDITCLKGFSGDFKSPEVLASLRAPARFVSIDGSHDAVDVLYDLALADQVLHPRGIVALDDFLNTECLGVVEAASRFLERKPQLVPFLFTSNKLFFAPLRAAPLYYEFLDRFAEGDTESAQSVEFAGLRKRSKVLRQTDFFGHSVLIM